MGGPEKREPSSPTMHTAPPARYTPQSPGIPDEQKVNDVVNSIKNSQNSLQIKGHYYIVSSTWFSELHTSSNMSRENNPINNADLYENGELKNGLELLRDFVAIDQDDYSSLCAWFGILNPSSQVVTRVADSTSSIDLYPVNITVKYGKSLEFSLGICKLHTFKDVTDLIAKHPSMVAESTENLKFQFQGNNLDPLDSENSEKIFLESFRGYELYVLPFNETTPGDVVDQGGMVTDDLPTTTTKIENEEPATSSRIQSKREKIKSHLDSYNSTSPFYRQNNDFTMKRRPTATIGCVGLSNLGNTCYMNSALQCLSNAAQLTSFILKDQWRQDLNRDNPMGMNGQVAEKYASLIADIWNTSDDRSSSVAPRQFKYTIGAFNSQFSGYFQQDAQELLGSLLDGLHEDLNRILKKPYVEIPDMDGMPDSEIATKMWEYYRMRNDSVIVDYFQGEYRSKVVCRTCSKSAVTFDPYMFLTLPIPQNVTSTFGVIVFPLSDASLAQEKERPFKMGVSLPRDSDISALKSAVGEKLGWSTYSKENSVVVEVFSSKIYKVFEERELTNDIPSSDVVYIVPVEKTPPRLLKYVGDTSSLETVVPVYLQLNNSISADVFGNPSFISLPPQFKVPKKSTNEFRIWLANYIYRQICSSIRRYATRNLFRRAGVEATQEPMVNQEVEGSAGESKESELDSAADEIFGDPGEGWEPIPDLFSIVYVAPPESSRFASRFSVSNSFYNSEYSRSTRKTSIYPVEPPTEDMKSTVGESDDDSNETIDENVANESNPPPEEELLNFEFIGEAVFVLTFNEENATKYFGDTGKFGQRNVGGNQLFKHTEGQDYTNFCIEAKKEQEKQKSKVISLSDCLNEFTKEEVLGESDTFYCKHCKEHRTIKKTIDIWTVPDILVFSLKRFSSTLRSSFRSVGGKIDSLIDFPLEGLDISSFVGGGNSMNLGHQEVQDDDFIYDLFAVSNHIGGIGGGHYTAYGMNPLDGEWCLFDDSHVRKANLQDIVSREAYMLFYQKRNSRQKHVKELEQVIETVKQTMEKERQQQAKEQSPIMPIISASRSSSADTIGSTSPAGGFFNDSTYEIIPPLEEDRNNNEVVAISGDYTTNGGYTMIGDQLPPAYSPIEDVISADVPSDVENMMLDDDEENEKV